MLKETLLDRFDVQGPEIGNVLKIVKQRRYIRKELFSSRATCKALGIYCPTLGEGMFLTAVDDMISGEKEEIVVLKPYDMNGILLPRTHLSISEIRSVCPFESLYENPLIKEEKQNSNLTFQPS